MYFLFLFESMRSLRHIFLFLFLGIAVLTALQFAFVEAKNLEEIEWVEISQEEESEMFEKDVDPLLLNHNDEIQDITSFCWHLSPSFSEINPNYAQLYQSIPYSPPELS